MQCMAPVVSAAQGHRWFSRVESIKIDGRLKVGVVQNVG